MFQSMSRLHIVHRMEKYSGYVYNGFLQWSFNHLKIWICVVLDSLDLDIYCWFVLRYIQHFNHAD